MSIASTEVAGRLVTARSAQVSGRDLGPSTPEARALVEQCRDTVAKRKEAEAVARGEARPEQQVRGGARLQVPLVRDARSSRPACGTLAEVQDHAEFEGPPWYRVRQDRGMQAAIEPVEVFLGSHKDPHQTLFGPLPGRRLRNVLTYEMQAPSNFEPWPGRTRVERKYALIDVGVSFGNPCWSRATRPDGTVIAIPVEQQDSWYVDLVTIERGQHDGFVLRDLYVDVMICDGRLPRMLDLDELADACTAGTITPAQLTDGLRRWQRFLDQYLHASRFPQLELTDFPPAAIRPLAQIEGLLGPPVTWPG